MPPRDQPTPSPSRAHEEPRQRELKVAKWFFWTLPIAILAIVSGLVTVFFGPVWPMAPEIELTGSYYDLPTVFPYSIKNTSVLFPLKVEQWHCVVDHAMVGTNRLINVDAGNGNEVSIDPRSSTNYRCGIAISGYHISDAALTVKASYRNLFHHFKDAQVSKCFQWIDAGSNSIWIEGCETH